MLQRMSSDHISADLTAPRRFEPDAAPRTFTASDYTRRLAA